MKKINYMLAIIAAGTLGLSTVTLAQGYGNGGGHAKGGSSNRFESRVDRRQDRQWARISNAKESGELSRREARRLRKDQQKIDRMERRFERDGYYSPRERRVMERALDRASHRIKRAKNNDYRARYGRHQHAPHGGHHGYGVGPYAYEESDETYVASTLSSTTLSAQAEGFSVSWSASSQQ